VVLREDPSGKTLRAWGPFTRGEAQNLAKWELEREDTEARLDPRPAVGVFPLHPLDYRHKEKH
jgi:hypothetical protein